MSASRRGRMSTATPSRAVVPRPQPEGEHWPRRERPVARERRRHEALPNPTVVTVTGGSGLAPSRPGGRAAGSLAGAIGRTRTRPARSAGHGRVRRSRLPGPPPASHRAADTPIRCGRRSRPGGGFSRAEREPPDPGVAPRRRPRTRPAATRSLGRPRLRDGLPGESRREAGGYEHRPLDRFTGVISSRRFGTSTTR